MKHGYQPVKCAEAPFDAILTTVDINFEEEIANGIFGKISSILQRKMHIFVEYLEDIMKDCEDRLLETFPEDSLPEPEDTILPIFHNIFKIIYKNG